MERRQALEVAREIAAARDEGDATLEPVASRSSHVFVSPSAVIKIADADGAGRFDREVALATDLPAGLSAPVLDHGRWTTRADALAQYVRVARLPGRSAVMGLPGVDRPTAVRWARQAAVMLQRLHAWTPSAASVAVLEEPLDHGGFTTRARLRRAIDAVRTLDPDGMVPSAVVVGLDAIADAAPERASSVVPVHADCHWENWLIDGGQVTALLDFEWARFGEPADDWMFLARFSGMHRGVVLRTIAELTGSSMDELRGACEVREAAYLVSDLLVALEDFRDPDRREVLTLLPDLAELSVRRAWRQP